VRGARAYGYWVVCGQGFRGTESPLSESLQTRIEGHRDMGGSIGMPEQGGGAMEIGEAMAADGGTVDY